jgi:diguanylate cyclase (GGDEF)-like protein
MKPNSLNQQIESKIASLYKHSYITTLIHFLAAGFLVYCAWNIVHLDLIFQWASLLICSLLVSVLSFTIFNRKRSNEPLDYATWENYSSGCVFLVSAVFALGYCYIVLTAAASMYPIVAFTMVMHLSCILIPNFSSKKVMLWFALCLSLPLIASLFFVAVANAIILGAGLFVYTCVLLFVSFNVNNTVNDGFDIERKYSSALKLVNKYKHKLATSTIEDPETQIFNRRFFDLISGEEIRRAKRSNHSLNLALIEIDCFDEYIENYGRERANKCLRTVAKLLSNATPRGGEYVTRFDDSKFVLIAPHIAAKEVVAFTTKMMEAVYNAEIEHNFTKVKLWNTVSISVGISEFKPGDLSDIEDIIRQAFSALKTAIECGRNNTKLFGENGLTKHKYIANDAQQPGAALKVVDSTFNIA